MAAPQTVPYGSWKSPISTELIVAESIGLGEIVLDGEDTYWTESRATEKGRSTIVRRTPDGQQVDVTPRQFNIGTAIHEYGSRGFTVADGVVYFSAFDDHRLYRQRPGEQPAPITPEGDLRYAAMRVDRNRNRIICVREDHTGSDDHPDNTIVSIDVSGRGEVEILVSGNHFYASPRLSPDGSKLAWLAWDHPNMPWDGTELWVAPIGKDGVLGTPTLVAGSQQVSIGQPEWSPDGALYFLSDDSRWFNLYRWQNDAVERLVDMEAVFAKTYWWTEMNSYGFDSASSLVCSYSKNGRWQLARFDMKSKRLDPLPVPYTAMGDGDLKVTAGRVVFSGGSPVEPMSILELNLATEKLLVLQVSITADIDPAYLSAPEPIEYPTENGVTAHAYYYPPTNPLYVAPSGEKPLLLVTCHGGPIGRATTTLDLWTQYWTSRGIAVLDVNYGGSAGYGRDYRERLIGEWGVVDVDDAINGALYLVSRGDVDPKRLIINGGSAGGYTALAALTFRDVFAAGASHFGVSDLETLLDGIHKFDTHSLDGLIGPYPLFRKKYQERSPINFVEDLTRPVIFFQGLDDTIVPADQSDTMFEVLKRKGVPTAYITYEGEGHGFVQAANIRRTLEAELYFYSRVFGFELAEPVEPVHIENM